LRPCSRSWCLFFHHRRDPSALSMIEARSARVARIRVVRLVFRTLVRMILVHFSAKAARASSAAVCRNVDCAAMLDDVGRTFHPKAIRCTRRT
jgi:hypothetical protein